MWDWVLLMTSLLTALFWNLVITPHGADLVTMSQSAELLSFNIDLLLAEDGDVCSMDSAQPWVSPATEEVSDSDCRQLEYWFKLIHFSDNNLTQNDLIVQNMNLFTDKLKPRPMPPTCVLPDLDRVESRQIQLHGLLNNRTDNNGNPSPSTVICINSTTAFSIMKLIEAKENTLAAVSSRKQNAITNVLANLTFKLKNKNPNRT